MKAASIIILLSCFVYGCQFPCPPELAENFEGEGFIISQEPSHTAAVFVPACQINQQHYLTSLRADNLGDGITVPIYNFGYKLMIANPRQRFKLLNPPDTLGYPYDGVYILPVRLRYKDFQHDSPVVRYSMNFKLKECEIVKPYIRASQQIDTIEFLPYTP